MAKQVCYAIKYVMRRWRSREPAPHTSVSGWVCGYFAVMKCLPDRDFLLLMSLKKRYGDLNTALVAEYLRAYGDASISAISQDVGLARATVRRALQKVADSASSSTLDAD